MTTIPIVLDAATLRFYERVAENAGLPVAQVLADAPVSYTHLTLPTICSV